MPLFGGGGMPNILGQGGMGQNAFGAMGLNFQPHRIPIVGPMLFGDPNEQFNKEQMHRAAQTYAAMRPGIANAQMNALMGASQFQQPGSNAMQDIFGEGYGIGAGNEGPMYANPLPPSLMGNPSFGPGPSPVSGTTPGAQQGGGGFLGSLPDPMGAFGGDTSSGGLPAMGGGGGGILGGILPFGGGGGGGGGILGGIL